MLNKILTILLLMTMLFFASPALAEAATSLSSDVVESSRPEVIQTEVPFLPNPIGAPGTPEEAGTDPVELREFFLQSFLPQIGQLLLSVLLIVSFGMMLYAGALYYTTFGNTDQADKAKRVAIYAIVGLVVAILSLAMVQAVNSLPFF